MTANQNLLARQFSRADLKQRVTNDFPARRLRKKRSLVLESSLTPILLTVHEAHRPVSSQNLKISIKITARCQAPALCLTRT